MDIYPNNIDARINDPAVVSEESITTIRNSDVIKETIDWFDEQIKQTELIDNIWANPSTGAEEVKLQILVQKRLKAILEMKKGDFEQDLNIAVEEMRRLAGGNDE